MNLKEIREWMGIKTEYAERARLDEFNIVLTVKEMRIIYNALKRAEAEAACECDSCKCTESVAKPYNELEATVPLMLSDDYKARFVAEYRQTKYRYERLKAFCNRIEAARMTPERDEIEEPKHDCPLELLRAQQRAMGEYLRTLEIRAVIERIEL